MKEKLNRLDIDEKLKERLLPFCRLKQGEIWEDPLGLHKVGLLDATSESDIKKLFGNERSSLFTNDPPYNVVVGAKNTANLSKIPLDQYMDFSKKWIDCANKFLQDDGHFYIWLGADIKGGLQPLPDIIIMMRNYSDLKPRNYITLRNQRGYGTSKNWMWVRQELLHYTKGKPHFTVVYTDIPKILKGGYYKMIGGKKTDTAQRSLSDTIRPGNVWVDIQQVFYRMEENVPGCYAQKPLKAIERLIKTGSSEGEIIGDLFSHSGTTLIAAERLKRRGFCCDNDPVFAELTIRRLERLRETGKTGWQWEHPFPEIADS